jgi:DUF4097 and DUF4098 domain-containing protein YvlB
MTTTLVRRAGVLALIAATTTTLTGCAGVLGATMTYNDTEKAKITDIVLTGGSGDVEIKTAAVQQTTITRIVQRSSNPEESYKLSGTTLNIDTSCGHNCSVSYKVQAPVGVTVRGELDSGDLALGGVGATDVQLRSGDIAINDATGPVTARADSGDVTVHGGTGKVTIVTSSGDAIAVDVAGPVDVRADSGDVTVKLSAPGSVTGIASSGDVNVVVPAGSYRVSAQADSGDKAVNGLTEDPASKNVIDLQADSGDVTVTAAA